MFFLNRELTNQYGYLKFDSNELSSVTRLSQYIRLALGTNAKTVVEFLQRAWRLPTPDLIISVTGGGKQCNMSTHLRKTFQRGLVTAAATTSKTSFYSKKKKKNKNEIRRVADHGWNEYGCD